LSHKAVHTWLEKFSQGPSKVADDARPGHPVEIATEGTVHQVEVLIRADRRNDKQCINFTMCFRGLGNSIMHGHVKFHAQRTDGTRKSEPNGSVIATSLMLCR
jgi:hypothetical protein